MGGEVGDVELRGCVGEDARAGSRGEEGCRQRGGGEGRQEEEDVGELHFGGGFGWELSDEVVEIGLLE